MTTRRPVQHKLVGKLTVDTEFGTFLGDTRIRLLESIDPVSYTHLDVYKRQAVMSMPPVPAAGS